jgi:glucan 1,3-beta-glucosidase
MLTLFASYLEAHNIIRNITGVGEGKGPLISIHDGFIGLSEWAGFLEGADRLGLDCKFSSALLLPRLR